MSGKKARAARQALREQPAFIVNADYARRAADAVLAIDLSDVPLTRVTQFIVGWCRAAFDQSRVIADLTSRGMASSAAPNRRTFAELTVRLHWLQDLPQAKRAEAVDTMLDHSRENTRSTLTHLREMGWETDFDLTEMSEFVLNVTDDKAIREQARKLASAAHATEVKNAGMYGAWREESTFAHASGPLAGRYAPAMEDRWLGVGAPPVMDPDLEGHRYATMLVVMLTGWLLKDEGVHEVAAMRIANAYFGIR